MDKRDITVSQSFSGVNEKPTEIDVLIDKSKQPETGNAGTPHEIRGQHEKRVIFRKKEKASHTGTAIKQPYI
jgi:hypothetical protein